MTKHGAGLRRISVRENLKLRSSPVDSTVLKLVNSLKRHSMQRKFSTALQRRKTLMINWCGQK